MSVDGANPVFRPGGERPRKPPPLLAAIGHTHARNTAPLLPDRLGQFAAGVPYLFLWKEYGLGELIQYFRYAPLVNALAAG
jgi:hypothetical protein